MTGSAMPAKHNEDRLYRRLLAWQAGLVAVGVPGWWLWGGVPPAISFLTGAAAAGVSFWFLHRLTQGLGRSKPGARTMLAAALRLLLIGIGISAILANYQLQAGAAAFGIAIVVVSILLEVLREHFYAS